MQILQRLNVPSVEEGNSNLSIQDSPVYVGMDSHMPRLGDKKNEKEKKDKLREKTGKENKKGVRRAEDGLLLVVPTKIYGKSIRSIDSGTTRCFITPS